jgi:crotonobetainyl-CoA:carnitine CoA-transferase CaiB-like acyl-CoA transferase
MNNALEGLKVVELGTFITGPCAGMMLADLGADVIKIESPDGDPYRSYQGENYSPHFQAYNRNKRSLALDLKKPADRELLDQLIRQADVFIQNFRPGTADRLGAGYERLKGLNPKLVYCSISGFGSTGPYVERPSYDSVAQALSGFLSVVVDPANPQFLGPALADAITGIYAAYGVLGALVRQARAGQGALVEVSMLEAMSHFAVEPFAAFFALGVAPRSSDRPKLAQAYILKSADERLIAIHLSSLEKFWTGLIAALEDESLARDPRFSTRLARIDNHHALRAELTARFAKHDLAHWEQRLGSQDVPYAPINSIEQVVKDPQVEHMGLIVPVEGAHPAEKGGERAVRPAVQFGGERASQVYAAPLLNEHGATIRGALQQNSQWPMRR